MVIPLAADDSALGEALIIPANSPVRLKSFNRQEVTANFEGQFILTGRWAIDPDSKDPFLVPDPAVAKTLPHWKVRGGPAAIQLDNSGKFLDAMKPKRGKLRKAGGHIAIWVDHYSVSIVCDAPEYDVDFIRVAQPFEVAENQSLEDSGCL